MNVERQKLTLFIQIYFVTTIEAILVSVTKPGHVDAGTVSTFKFPKSAAVLGPT